VASGALHPKDTVTVIQKQTKNPPPLVPLPPPRDHTVTPRSIADAWEHPAGMRLLGRHHSDPLTHFMRGDVTRRLGVIPPDVTWGSQSARVFEHLAGDFMVDSIASVDAVLAKGDPPPLEHLAGDFKVEIASLLSMQCLPKVTPAAPPPPQLTPLPHHHHPAGSVQAPQTPGKTHRETTSLV